jgi:hypothetical protein
MKDIAPTLWENPPLFDLAENLTQCREYHREQLCNWSKVGRSLSLTCRGQISESCSCVKETRERALVCEEFRSLSLIPLAHKGRLTFWPLQVKPSDLPTFDQLQSYFLWYSLHCVKFSAKSNGGGFPQKVGAIDCESFTEICQHFRNFFIV